jgi:hypothetical protein
MVRAQVLGVLCFLALLLLPLFSIPGACRAATAVATTGGSFAVTQLLARGTCSR